MKAGARVGSGLKSLSQPLERVKAGLWRYPEASNLQLLYLPVTPRKGTRGHLEIPGSVSPGSWHIFVFAPLTSE